MGVSPHDGVAPFSSAEKQCYHRAVIYTPGKYMTLAQEKPVNLTLPEITFIKEAWTQISLLDQKSDIISLHVAQNQNLVVATKNKIWRYRGDEWELIASSPTSGNISQYLMGETVAYAVANHRCYRMHFENDEWSAIVNSPIIDAAITDGDTLWGVDSNGNLSKYIPGHDWVTAQVPALTTWNIKDAVGIAAKGDSFWFGLKYKTKQLFEQDKNSTACETVWQIQAGRQFTQTDITENIGLLNLNSNFLESFGQLCMTPDGILYASTEEGIWQRSTTNSGWTQLKSHSGNINLFALSDSSLLTYNPRSQELLWWNKQAWHLLPKPTHEIVSAALVGDVLYIASNNVLSSISVKTAQSLEPPLPRMATYLNIGKLGTAIYCKNQLFVTNQTTLFRLGSDNSQPIPIASLPNPASDISNSGDDIFIATTSELIKYNITTNQISLVSTIPTPSQKVRVDSDGNFIAYLTDKTIRLFDNNNNLITQTTINANFVEDIAIKKDKLYVVGYNNQKNKKPVQSAFLRCFQITNILTQIWQTWGFLGSQLANDMADTRLYRVVASDNEVVVCGESAGGNTAFRWNGKDLSTPTIISYDVFNDPYNTKDAHFSYYAIVDASTGTVKRGQFSIPRLIPFSTRSNTNRNRTLSFDKTSVYLGTFSSFQISDRDFVKFLGKNPPPYKNGDAVLLKVPNDMSLRSYWFTPGNGQVVTFNSDCAVINVAPDTPEFPLLNGKNRLNRDDAYVIIW